MLTTKSLYSPGTSLRSFERDRDDEELDDEEELEEELDEEERFLDELDQLLLAFDSPRYGCTTWSSFAMVATSGWNLVTMVHNDIGVAADWAHHSRCRRRRLRARRRRELSPEDEEDEDEDDDVDVCACVALELERCCGVPLSSVSRPPATTPPSACRAAARLRRPLEDVGGDEDGEDVAEVEDDCEPPCRRCGGMSP